MGDLWFTLGVRSNIAATVNKALKELKDVDGAVSVLNEKLIQAQQAYKAALSAKGTDPKVLQSLREEINAWSKGVDNALAYQGMLQKVNKELRNISTLRNISVGVDKSKLDEAEGLLRKFRNDLTNVTFAKLGGTDSNTYLSKFRKALGLTLNDVHDRIEAFRKDNSLTDAATRTATLERALANVQRRLESIRQLQSEAAKGGYNANTLLAAGNRMRGVEGRISKMLADKDLLNNEAKYRTLLSDIGKAAAKAALDVEKYKTAKDRAVAASTTQGNIDLNTARLRDVTALLDRIQGRYTNIMGNSNVGGIVQIPGDLPSKIAQLEALRTKLLSLSNSDLGKKGIIERLLKTENFGTIRNEVNSLLRDMEKGIRQADKTAEQASNNQVRNAERIQAKIRSLYDLLAKAYEARNRGNALGMDTTRLDRDISFIRGKMQELRAILSSRNVPSSKGWRLSSDIEGRLSNVSRHVKDISRNMSAAKARTQETTQAAQQLAAAFDRIRNKAGQSSQILSDIKSLFLQGGIVFAAQQFFNQVVRTGGEIEQQHIALKSILGDVSKANELFDQTKRLALESPFTFGELNRDVKQLAAFGVDADNLYDTTKRLADIAAGLGVSFERLGLAYGQVKSRSWLDGKELRQFAYAGLPMLQKLSDYYNQTRGDKTYTTRDVREMITKREVSFEDVDAVIKRLTDEGGQFYNLQYVLSETLLGQYNKLKDAWDIMLGQLASGNSLVGKFFKTGIQLATAFVQRIDSLGPVLAAAFSGVLFGRLKGAFAGNIGKSILSAKGALALEYERAALAGKKLNATQREILATKRQITAQDVSILAKNKALTANDLRRLYIMRQITREQYKQAMAGIGQNVGNFGRAGAAGSLLVNGIKSGATSLFNLMGGWIGIGITAVTIAFAKWQQAKQEMQDSIDRINEEQNARYKSVDDFLMQNPVDKARSATTEQDRIAAVENYKEKLKEVAPYNAAAFEMGVSEKKSHEERINYLSQELELVRDANDYVTRNSDRLTRATKGDFEDTADEAKDLENIYSTIEKRLGELHIQDIQQALPRMAANAGTRGFAQELQEAINKGETLQQLIVRIKGEIFSANGAKQYNTSGIRSIARGLFGNGVIDGYNLPNGVDKYVADYYDQANAFKKKVEELKKTIQKEIPNVGKDPTVTEAYKQFRESLEGQMQLSPEEKEMINISLDEAFGIGNDDLQVKLADKLRTTIDQTMPEIAAKIRSGQELNEADRKKVQDLMNTAVDELKVQYPFFQNELQSLLDNSNFTATIHLAYAGDEWNELQKQFYNNLPTPFGDTYKYELSNLASSWLKDNSMYKARNAAQSDIKAAYNELVALQDAQKKGKATDDQVAKASDKLQKLKDAAKYGLGYDYDGELAKSNKPPKQDHSAERAREKAERAYMRARQKESQSIQSYYETWDKWRKVEGDEAARNRVANDPRFSADFRKKYSNPEDLAGNYEKLANAIAQTTDERRQFVQELKSKAAEKEGQIEYENAQRLNNIFKEQLDNLSKRYELYERLSKVAGREVAGNMAFGLQNHSDSYYSYLKQRVSDLQNGTVRSFVDNGGVAGEKGDVVLSNVTVTGKAPKVDFSPYGGLEGVMALPDEDVLAKFGTNVSNLIKALKAERDKLDASIVESLESGYSYYQDYGAEVDAITQKYEQQIERLKERNQLEKDNKDYISDETLQQQTTVLQQQQRRDIAAVGYKQMQDSDAYRMFFGATFLLGSKQAKQFGDTIKDGLTAVFKNGGMSATEYAEKIEEVNKRMQDVGERRSDTFTYLFGGGIDAVNQRRYDEGKQQYELYTGEVAKYKRQYDEAEANGDEEGMAKAQQAMDESQEMADAGKNMMNTASKGLGTVAIIDKIVNGINDNVQSLKKLFDDIADTIEVFGGKDKADNFRNSGAYAFVSGFSNASQGATDAWNSLKSGNVMGVIEGGYRSIIGWATPWAKRHDAKLEKQIEQLSRINTALDNVRSSIERNLNNTLGSVYAYNSKYKDAQAIRDGIAQYQKDNGSWFARMMKSVFGGSYNASRYKTSTYQQMQQANKTGAAYDQELAAYMMQRDNLETQLDKERDKKSKDKDKIQDYENQIDELNDTISTFAKDMAKSLYGIDVSSWAKSLSDTIVDAWASGEDAAEAYHDKVRDLMKDLTKNIIAKKYMEIALQPIEDFIEKEMQAKSGKLDELDINKIADMLLALEDDSVNTITSLLEKLKDNGLDLSDTSSSSMSSSIKGITENTADIIAAYLNAIRADVSVIRQLTGLYMPKIDITTQAQLQQLTMIAQNTLRNADAAESIQRSVMEVISILNAVTNDAKRFNTKAH